MATAFQVSIAYVVSMAAFISVIYFGLGKNVVGRVTHATLATKYRMRSGFGKQKLTVEFEGRTKIRTMTVYRSTQYGKQYKVGDAIKLRVFRWL